MPDMGEEGGAAAPGSHTAVPGPTAALRQTEGEHGHATGAGATAGAPLDCVEDALSIVRALLAGRHGELVRLQTPGGIRLLAIVDISDEAEPG